MKTHDKKLFFIGLVFLLLATPAFALDETACSIDLRGSINKIYLALQGSNDENGSISTLIDEDGEFVDLKSGNIINGEAVTDQAKIIKNTIFPDIISFEYFKDFVYRTAIDNHTPSKNSIVFSRGKNDYTYTATPPTPDSNCETRVTLNMRTFIDDEFGYAESSHIYYFACSGGQIKLVRSNVAG